mmetsp:Transcript_36053/g.58170  ORF Transcript_36053/g.58170 Transcript_36053/m.58170 type:complete len:265 (-) Transcript_36053:71-865(-)
MPGFQFELEYAKSNRAACKQCKEKIAQGALKIGVKAAAEAGGEGDAADRQKSHVMDSTKWQHTGCFQQIKGTPWFKKNLPESASGCSGFDDLKAEEQEHVNAIFAACRGEGPAPPATSQGAAQEEKAGKKRPKAAASADEDGSAQKQARVGEDAMTKQQFAAIEAAKADLLKKNVAALGMMLAKNGLPKSGNKAEVLERAAEAKALGVPPKCPTCTKVALRWSRVTGAFSCPGFFDDDAKRFKKCKGPDADAKLERTPWQNLTA